MMDRFSEATIFLLFIIATVLSIFFLIVAINFIEGLWDRVDDLEDRVERCERYLDIEC